MEINKNLIFFLRGALILIFLGLVVPICCKSNGFQVSMEILGNGGSKMDIMSLGHINLIYGYMFLSVFIFAALGFIISFLSKVKYIFLYSSVCLIVSAILLFIFLYKIQVYFDFSEFGFFVKTVASTKIKLLFGAYLMIVGYLLGIVTIILKLVRGIN